ncbi:MAG TPA: universal stress protein [Phenylobacterium sp.]|nr:universal stress protein [Phenylobacterium sp.]
MIIRKTSLPLALGLALTLAACDRPSSQSPGFQHAVPGKAVITVSGVEISTPIFESFAAAQGLALEWRTAHDMPARAMAAHARSADLLVIRATAQRDYFRAVDPGELVLHAGRPVLLAPQSDTPLRGEAVVVGWKETRESRRALADALPLLRRARTVALTAVHGPGEGAASAAALEQVCAYLAGHGIAAEPSPIEAPDADVVDLLNARAQAIGADLIVTGAYGQSRLREWVFGGVTRRLMDEPRTWLFMSH